MLDIKLIRENPNLIKEKLKLRGDYNNIIESILSFDNDRRQSILTVEKMKSIKNKFSQGISVLKIDSDEKFNLKLNELKQLQNEINKAIHEFTPYLTQNLIFERNRIEELIKEMSILSEEIKKFDAGKKLAETKIDELLRDIPNLPENTVPLGKSADDNVQFRIWGEKAAGDFKYLDHVELGKKLDILDFQVGAKISGSGFPFYKGKGAILERALINFMLDTHRTNGYIEVYVPFLVNRESMEAAEKVPKFEEDMYRTDPDDLFAIPTAEVPILNIHRDETLNLDMLPLKYCGFTACFRREAGSYGKDTKGFLRVHQFNKVELINFCTAENSYDEMEKMLGHACGILEALNIHYRVVNVCTGDMGFAASKQYDIEVWSPAENKWLEASSVSNCTDFQSRRANIRTRRDKKLEFVHILNGSGLATSRLYVALIESNQTPEGKIIIPSVLQEYTGFEIIG